MLDNPQEATGEGLTDAPTPNPLGLSPGSPISFGSTVTILFSDIRGFTEFTERYGDEVAYRMLQHHNTLVQEQIALHHGHVVKTLGDSFMVSFDSARTAVTCAVAMQRAIARHNAAQQGPQIAIGVGIDTGEPVRDADDFFGGTVNRASRICASAGAGRILASETVRHVVGRMQGASWIDRGHFEVRGFDQPLRLFEVEWSGEEAVRAAPAPTPDPGGDAAPPPVPAPASATPGTAAIARRSRRPFLIGTTALISVTVVVVALLASVGLRQPDGQAPAPSDTKAGDETVFSTDDFSDPRATLFPLGEGATSGGVRFERRVVDGTFLVRVMPGPGSQVVFASGPVVSGPRFAVEFETRADGNVPVEPGMALGSATAGYVHMVVNPRNGGFRAYYAGEGRNVTLSSVTNPAIRRGSDVNRLRVEVRDDQARVFVNGVLIDSLTHDSLKLRPAAPFLGVITPADGIPPGEDARALFDNYRITELRQPG